MSSPALDDLEIWLVNDDPAQLLVQKRLLGRFAATVWDFQSPTELVAQARKYGSCPNLVSDFHMPGMNGLELSQLWCQMHPDARVLLISASELTRAEKEEATYLPSNRVKLMTAYRIPEVLNAAKEWFGGTDREAAKEDSLEKAPAPPQNLSYFDSDVLDKLKILGGSAFVKKALIRFSDRIPTRLANFYEYIEEKSHRKIHQEAHSLKGSCGIVGATQMLECAHELEEAAKDEKALEEIEEQVERLESLWQETARELKEVLQSCE